MPFRLLPFFQKHLLLKEPLKDSSPHALSNPGKRERQQIAPCAATTVLGNGGGAVSVLTNSLQFRCDAVATAGVANVGSRRLIQPISAQ